MKSIDSETFSLPIVGQREINEEETVEVTLYDTQRGREVRSVHRRGGDRLDAYRFRVIDEAWNVCVHRSQTEPPIGVVQAVERFGYHVRDAASYPPEYADVQHIDHIFSVLSTIHSTSSDPLLRGFISQAGLSVVVGVSTLDLQATIVDDRGKDAFDEVLCEAAHRFADDDEEVVEIGVDELHRQLADVATDGGQLSPEEVASEDSMNAGDPTSTHPVNRQDGIESTVTLETSEVNGKRKMLVTAFGSDHVDRYTFDVLDREENRCVFQRADSSGRPPIEVIEEARQSGYEITNIPVPHPDDPVWEQLSAADHLLNDILESYETGSCPYEPLARGQKVIQNALAVAVIREAMEPGEYVRTLVQAVNTSAFVESVDELESVSTFLCLEDFLWEDLPEFIDSQTKREIGGFYEDRDIF